MPDLTALGALPGAWKGCEPPAIVEDLAALLLAALPASLVFARLDYPPGGKRVEVLRTDGDAPSAHQAEDVIAMLGPLLAAPHVDRPLRLDSLPNVGTLFLAVVPFGDGGEYGFLAAGASGTSFPDDSQRTFLRIGANFAAAALRERLLSDRLRTALDSQEGGDLFRSTFEHASVGMALTTTEGRFLHVNQAFCRITGYEHEELRATDFQSITHPDDAAASLEVLRRLLSGEAPAVGFEKRYVRKDGSSVWVQISVAFRNDKQGKPHSMVAIVQDVTDRKHVERALAQSEEGYRSLIETAREMLITVDCEGRFTSFNPAFSARTGWTDAEWIGRRFTEILPPEDVPACMAVFEACLRGETTPSVTHRLRTRDGEWLTFESTGTPQLREGRVVAVLGVARDVTLRTRAEAALTESRQRLQALFDNALDAILIADEEGRLVDANPAAAVLLGYSREELPALTTAGITPPEDLVSLQKVQRIFAEEGRFSGDYRLRRKDGSVLHAEFRSVAHILPGLHLAIVRDVTDRKRADEELRRSRSLLEQAEEVAHVGCWEWDVLANTLVWSAETYRILGLAASSFVPSFESFLELVHPEDRDFIRGLNERTIREGGGFAYDGRVLRPDGEVRFIHARGHAERDDRGRVVRIIGICQDITERKRTEQVRIRLMKRLISAHEEERARISRELHDGAGQALTALLVGLRRVESARSLTAARRAASRQRELAAQTIDEVGRLARGLRPAVLDDLGLQAALGRHVADHAWLFGLGVILDTEGLGKRRLPRELETTLYRIVQEALANAAKHAYARQVEISVTRDKGAVRLTVTDDGRGFDVESVLEKGTRLGLHGIQERAALAGGRAEILSRPGQGTRISVVIPVASREASRRRARNEADTTKVAVRQKRA